MMSKEVMAVKKSDIFLALDRCLKNGIPHKYHHFLTPVRKKIAPYFAKRLSSIWCVTWQCNFACPYCWQLEDPHAYRINNTIAYDEWLHVWKGISQQFAEITIAITGGEPFLFKDFIKLLAGLPDNTRYDVTSNLSLVDVNEFLSHEKIRRQCSGISCSFHPSNASNSANYIDVFFEKVQKLTVLPGTKVNFVPAASNLKFYKTLKEFCDTKRIPLHVKKHIVLNKPLDYAEEEERIAHDIKSSGSSLVDKANMRDSVSCCAGFSHLALSPNADVWPCYTKAALREDYLGNALSKEFRANARYRNCSFYPSCWAVDYHNVRVTKKKMH